MRCGCYTLLLGLGLTFGGGQGTYEWFQNRRQTVTTYANFEAQKPTGGWYKIKDARLDIPSAMWTASAITDEKDEIYVPLSPIGEDKPGTKIQVLLQIDDAATKQLVEEMSAFDKKNTPDGQVLAYVLKNRAKLFPTRAVEGMVKFGLNDLKSSDRNKIAALNPDLAEDFVVLEENAHPNVATSLLALIAGLLITLFSLAGFLSGGKSNGEPATATDLGPASPASGPPPPPMSGGNAG
jgi:hypothetical protein